jgi:hypothetical protein
MDREQESDKDMDREREREREQCIEWVRDQLRALRHTNRVYEQHVIRDIESRTKGPVPTKSTEAEAEERNAA